MTIPSLHSHLGGWNTRTDANKITGGPAIANSQT